MYSHQEDRNTKILRASTPIFSANCAILKSKEN